MRAAPTSSRFRGKIKRCSMIQPPSLHPGRISTKKRPVLENPLLYAVLFLAGYVLSVFYGRVLESDVGEQLAAYYMDSSHLAVWPASFLNQLAASFIQILFTFFCGFSAVGFGFLILFFAFKGVFLGFCAINILTLGGIKPLAVYWFCVCLPNILLLLVNLWIAGYSAQLSNSLFQSVFCGGAPRGRLEANARRLIVRTIISMPLLCLLCILGTGIAVLAVGIAT